MPISQSRVALGPSTECSLRRLTRPLNLHRFIRWALDRVAPSARHDQHEHQPGRVEGRHRAYGGYLDKNGRAEQRVAHVIASEHISEAAVDPLEPL